MLFCLLAYFMTLVVSVTIVNNFLEVRTIAIDRERL